MLEPRVVEVDESDVAQNKEEFQSKQEVQFKKFLDLLKQLYINISLVEAVEKMSNYVKFMKDIPFKKKRFGEFEIVSLTKECSAFLQNKLPKKMKGLGSFTIPCNIGDSYFERRLTMQVQEDHVTFNVFKSMIFPNVVEEYFVMFEMESLVSIEWELNFVDVPLKRVLMSDPPSGDEEEEYLALLDANSKG
ncbi:retrotransposon gag protein [Gossypium australe]|uniref:Retrotransposon gag protein n=1 Tax=Gossypium australe TaxID=47621 RepID=A0A5B6W9E8_9ROSI|nr:retrotransposon gag protein [Gossypium australe]